MLYIHTFTGEKGYGYDEASFMTGIYDLVIHDVIMDGVSGFSLYNEIRKFDDKLPICFLIAADELYYETLKKCHSNIDEGCIIHKPVDNDSTKTNKINDINWTLVYQ